MFNNAGRQIFREAPMMYSALQSISNTIDQKAQQNFSPEEQPRAPAPQFNRDNFLSHTSLDYLGAQRTPTLLDTFTALEMNLEARKVTPEIPTDNKKIPNTFVAEQFPKRTTQHRNLFGINIPSYVQEEKKDDYLRSLLTASKPPVIVPKPDVPVTKESQPQNLEVNRLLQLTSKKPNPLLAGITAATHIPIAHTNPIITNPEEVARIIDSLPITPEKTEDLDETVLMEEEEEVEISEAQEQDEEDIGGDSDDESTWDDEETEVMENPDETIPIPEEQEDDSIGGNSIDGSSNIKGDESLIPEDEELNFDPDGDGAMTSKDFENQDEPTIGHDSLDHDQTNELTVEQTTQEMSGGDSIDLPTKSVVPQDLSVAHTIAQLERPNYSSYDSSSDLEGSSSNPSSDDESELSNDEESPTEEEKGTDNSQSTDQDITEPLPNNAPDTTSKQQKDDLSSYEEAELEVKDNETPSSQNSFFSPEPEEKEPEKLGHSSNYSLQRIGLLFMFAATTCLGLYLYLRSKGDGVDLESALQNVNFELPEKGCDISIG